MNFLAKIFGDDQQAYLATCQRRLAEIDQHETDLTHLTNDDLAAKTPEFRARLQAGATLDEILPEAFAVVRETSRRLLGQRHFAVQLIGGIVLHEGKIAEMRTGEGKTLVATLPAYLNALSGRPVHIVTVNDYLARRDAVWMGQIYNFLGLSVGVLNNQASYLYQVEQNENQDQARDTTGSFLVAADLLRPCQRAQVYRADIVYGTNNEFGFDYLKDNLVYRSEDLVQYRPGQEASYAYAIIDEVDSILIDEARTPLIISAPAGESENLYQLFASIARQLNLEEDYTVDEKVKAISLTDEGISKAEKILGLENIYTEKGIKYVHHLETAVRAKALYERDKDYVVRDGEVVIVDEFTGRLQAGRRWSEGLHQAIEAKEGVSIKEESRTYATITLQNYFRLYDKLAGMTGTAKTSSEEFFKVYGLPVVSIPSNKISQRRDLPDLIFQTETGKFKAIAKMIKDRQERGQPVLVGTVSIEKNELLSAYFKQAGIQHQILNAKNHEAEGEIIAQAGKFGAVTIATNMAGRGVDIKLGGPTATIEEQMAIKDLGGLLVIGTERHEARRIDNQLRGRSGRQGDPGETQFCVSFEDSLMRVFASDRVKAMMGRFGLPEEEPIQNKIVSRAIENAQAKIEGLNFDARKYLLEYDDVTNHQRQTIYSRRRRILFANQETLEEFFAELSSALSWTATERQDFNQLWQSREQSLGPEIFWPSLRSGILQVIDLFWLEHLEAIEYMRGSVRLRAYGQRDPLVEFKREGLRMFKQMEESIYQTIAYQLLPNLGQEQITEQQKNLKQIKAGAEDLTNNQTSSSNIKHKVGRNDPCPCGATKADGTPLKYKHCCGA